MCQVECKTLLSAPTHTILISYFMHMELLEYVIFILWVRSVSKMLPSVKFAKDKLLTFLILREKC